MRGGARRGEGRQQWCQGGLWAAETAFSRGLIEKARCCKRQFGEVESER